MNVKDHERDHPILNKAGSSSECSQRSIQRFVSETEPQIMGQTMKKQSCLKYEKKAKFMATTLYFKEMN